MSATERIDFYPNVGLVAPALIGSQPMTSNLDIYRAAQATISRYGDGAGIHSAQRADELLAAGDMEGRAVWHRIERAIDELQRTAPGENKADRSWIIRRI